MSLDSPSAKAMRKKVAQPPPAPAARRAAPPPKKKTNGGGGGGDAPSPSAGGGSDGGFKLADDTSEFECPLSGESGRQVRVCPARSPSPPPPLKMPVHRLHSNGCPPPLPSAASLLSPPLRTTTAGEIMLHPVSCSDGHVYDRHVIEEWLADCDFSPMTRYTGGRRRPPP